MSQIPLSLALPTAAAAAAYLNARWSIFYDRQLLQAILPSVIGFQWRQFRGRANLFYRFESLATSKSSANRPFLRYEDKQWTYAQAYDVVLRYATWLRLQHGVKKGDIVALDFHNTDTFVLLVLAAWAVGATPALLNYNLTGRALAHCIKRATTRLVIVEDVLMGNIGDDVRSQLGEVQFVAFDPQSHAQVLGMDAIRPPDDLQVEATMDSMAILIYTSGTTGLPKAAIISWGKLCIVGAFSVRWIGTTSSDVFYTAMPLYHATAMVMGFSHSLAAGCTFALGRKFSTSHFWDEVRRHDATVIQYVGETCRYLLTAPPKIDPVTGGNLDRKHRVRVAFGNGMRPDIWNRFKERFGVDTVAEFYAATEGTFGTWNLSRNDFSKGAVGRNGFLYELFMGGNFALVKIDHEKEVPLRDPKTGFCQRVRPGEPGELLFKLPPSSVKSRFQGYYGDDEATNKKLLRDAFSKGDVWFRTGDVIRKDSEYRTYFTDRIGDTFRWKSENVSTAEVAEIMGLHPAIRELNVYGVQIPHHEGRAGCAAVVLDEVAFAGGPGGSPRRDVLQSLAAHARKGLPRYALPLFLRIARGGGLEATGTNKFPKNMLREQGVAPEKTAPDEVYWLKGDAYERFTAMEWDRITRGGVKL